MTDVKKAWEQMKKDLKKELGIEGGFVMNAKQISNRTATYTVCNNWTFDREIEYHKKEDERVQSYTTWTPEAKARSHKDKLAYISALEEEKAKYGTKENQAAVVRAEIVNSKAFQKFQDAVGKVETAIEIRENFLYYIRFNY